jgi:peptidyl-dipeptidase A
MCYFRPLPILLGVLILLAWPLAVSAGAQATERARQFIADHTAKLRPLEIAAGLAWWNANVSGKDEDFQKKIEAQNRIDEALSDPKAFAAVKKLKQERKDIEDPVIARAIDVLYLAYLEKQVDTVLLKQMVAKSNAVE